MGFKACENLCIDMRIKQRMRRKG